MPKLNQRGAIQFIVLLILLGGIAGGVYLATREEPFKLSPQAKVSRPIPRPTKAPRPTKKPRPTSIPTPTPTPDAYHRVFITSTQYQGNLGGFTGADAKCQERANAANLGGDWKVWLSDNTASAASRLNHSTLPYKRVDGTIIADNWADLTDGAIRNGIERTEFNDIVAYPRSSVWTGTDTDGSSLSINCNNWTSNTYPPTAGGYGFGTSSDAQWTRLSTTVGTRCDNNNSLYCVEQTYTTYTPPTPKRVFVTNASFNANLGGLSGADQKCTDRALAVGLGGFWKAWLSDSTIAAASRMSHSTVPYKLVNDVTIANNWNDLVDGTLQNPINITERGDTVSFGYVWTGTTRNGEISPTVGLPEYKCFDWTQTYGATTAGTVQSIDYHWTEQSGTGNCIPSTYRLYCFEQ